GGSVPVTRCARGGPGLGRAGRALFPEGLDVFVEGLSGDVIHDVIGAPLGRPALVDGHDVGVLELTQHADLALEPADLVPAGTVALPEHFDRHGAAGGALVGLENNPLTAAADLLEHVVAGDGRGRGADARGGG